MFLAVPACSGDGVPVAEAPPPPLADEARVRFVALGDVGRGTEGQRRVAAAVARVCEERGCDLVTLLGDNLYPRGMESPDDPRIDAWIAEMYAPVGAPLYLVLGNHDYGKGRDRERAAWQIAWAERTDGVELPANAWFTTAGPVRFVGIDTNAVFHWGGEFQSKWLRARLDESDATWKVVLGHHPHRSDGPHGNAGGYEGLAGVPYVSGRALRELFDESLCGRADLYLAGHDHLLELIRWCDTTLVVSGAGATATEVVDRGNDPLLAAAVPGAAWLELGPEDGRVAFFDAGGQFLAEFPLRPGR